MSKEHFFDNHCAPITMIFWYVIPWYMFFERKLWNQWERIVLPSSYLKKIFSQIYQMHYFFCKDNLIQKKQCIDSFQILEILPWLLQRSKRCHGHYSMIYHAMFQWVTRSDIHLSFLAQRKEICGFKIQNHNNYMLISRFRCGVD